MAAFETLVIRSPRPRILVGCVLEFVGGVGAQHDPEAGAALDAVRFNARPQLLLAPRVCQWRRAFGPRVVSILPGSKRMARVCWIEARGAAANPLARPNQQAFARRFFAFVEQFKGGVSVTARRARQGLAYWDTRA